MRSQVKIREAVREQDPDILVETLFRETAFIWPQEQTEQELEKWGEGQLCVVVSIFNRAEILAEVVTAVRNVVPEAHIVVVNDASTDATGAVAQALGVAVLPLPIHLGKSGATQTGLKYAARYGFEFVIQLDAGERYNVEQIADLLQELQEEEGDMVIGSRLAGKGDVPLPLPLRWRIGVMSWLVGIAVNRWIDDPVSRFRGYNLRVLEAVAGNHQCDCSEAEAVVLMIKHGYAVKEVSVEYEAPEVISLERRRWSSGWYEIVVDALAVLVHGIKRQERRL